MGYVKEWLGCVGEGVVGCKVKGGEMVWVRDDFG